MTWRPATTTGAWTLGTVAGALDDPTAARELLAMLRHVAGGATPGSVRVGLLGYGAIGHEHSRAVRAVAGLDLAAVGDTSAARREAAESVAPGIATTADGAELLARDDVDLVVVSTPPSSHADWALRAIRAGKHVVVEKPFAISTAEADAVLTAADSAGLLAVVYQNRRFDPDHLAVRRAVLDGALGDVFHVETFVGGYGHPCNLWHSDEGVSGGAFYDWGAHVLDQILDLVPTDIEHVTAAAHKRRWYDVTNADHSRVTIRFVDGAEAEFVHSDLAAALKPRWYVLGTTGALVGHWRTERIVSRNDIGTLEEDVLAPADSPPLLDLHRSDGSVTRLATPPAPAYAFHHELADRLRLGLPMTVTAQQSRRVLSVMEAARRSAEDSGRPVVPL
jgi:predicted dehydrogenase